MIIAVFGNETLNQDSTAIKLLPYLKKQFPTISFIIQDPTETIDSFPIPYIIMDTAININQVTLINSLDQLEHIKGSSVHDFDVYLDLILHQKLNPTFNPIIILIPPTLLPSTKKQIRQIITSLNV